MWASAFDRPFAVLAGPVKHGTTYLYEHSLVLVAIVLAVAAAIALAEAFRR
jgi:hypothetical protein